jgi:5-methylcytosine-specific restriction protein A
MPHSAPKICTHPGCYAIAYRGSRCSDHPYTARIKGGYNRAKGNTTDQGYGWSWQKLRPRILRRDGYRCCVCGNEATEVDHIIPKAQGGTDDPDNLQSICRRCHRQKTARGG